MRGVASDEAELDGVAVEEEIAMGGSVFDAVRVEPLLRLASLTDAEVAAAFPAVPERGMTE